MNQRGVSTLIQVVAVLVAAAALIWAITALWSAGVSWLEQEKKNEYDRGRAEVTAEVVKQDNKILEAARLEAASLRAKIAELEKKAAKVFAALEAKQNKENRDAQAQKDQDDAAASAGVIRLCDYWWGGDPKDSTWKAGVSTSSTVTAPTTSGNGTCGRQFSVGATQRLLREANRADQYARQLQNAQQVIISQQGMCTAED